jgi:DUF4097 and DUF4098 domain-containing protein YvlB
MNTTSRKIGNCCGKAMLSFGNQAAPVLAVLLAALFFGCGARVERTTDEVFEQTYKIEPHASLSIRNADGSIAIHGTETGDLRVQATKKANSREELKAIGITALAETNSVSINTKFLPQKNKPLSAGARRVEYTLAVPPTVRLTRVDLEDGKVLIEGMKGDELRASVVDGQLAIRNCCGNAHVAIANGTLDLFYERCDRQKFSVNAQITNGNARLFIRRGASSHIQAETTTGKIINEFPDMVDLNSHAMRKVDIFTGKGLSPEIKLRVTTGDIKIAEAGSDVHGTVSN